MDNEHQARQKHFTALKSKYENSSASSLLYLILRKADLGIEITDLEFDWLRKHQLSETIEIIWLKQRISEETKRLEAEFSLLKSKYKVPASWESSLSNFLYPILWKLEYEGDLNDSEIELLKSNKLDGIVAIAQQMKHFATLKAKYKATHYQDLSPESPLYQILKQLDAKESLSDENANWLLNNELFEIFDIFEQQEAERKAEAEFAQLKVKYQASKHPDTSVSSPLWQILKKLEADRKIIYSEIDWLEKQGLTQTIAIAKELEKQREFAAMKIKYQVTQYEDSSPYSHLYAILKTLELGSYLSEPNINFLQKCGLNNLIALSNERYVSSLKSKVNAGEQLSESEIEWLKNNEREDIITLAQQKHFATLKSKYRILDPNLPIEPFYTIMLKLEREERLDPLLVVKLITQVASYKQGRC